jgi:hypothetical protein
MHLAVERARPVTGQCQQVAVVVVDLGAAGRQDDAGCAGRESALLIEPGPDSFAFQGTSNNVMLVEILFEGLDQKEHVEVGLGQIALFQMNLLHDMHEGHVDEGPGDRVLDLFDESESLVAVLESSGCRHISLPSIERCQ